MQVAQGATALDVVGRHDERGAAGFEFVDDLSYERHAKLIGTAFPYPPGPMDFPPVPGFFASGMNS